MDTGTCSDLYRMLELVILFIGCMQGSGVTGIDTIVGPQPASLRQVASGTGHASMAAPSGVMASKRGTPPVADAEGTEEALNNKRFIESILMKSNEGLEGIKDIESNATSPLISIIAANNKENQDMLNTLAEVDVRDFLDATNQHKLDGHVNVEHNLDGIASTLIKREDKDINSKRYIDDIGSSFIKKSTEDNPELQKFKHHFLNDFNNDVAEMESEFLNNNNILNVSAYDYLHKHKQSNTKRYMDSVGSSLIKRSDNQTFVDSNSYPKLEDVKFLYPLDHLYDDVETDLSTMKAKAGHNKRYLDGITGSFLKREAMRDEDNHYKRYLDGINSLIKREGHQDSFGLDSTRGSNKRYLDGITSSFIGKRHTKDKRYLDNIGSSLIKRENQEHTSNKRYLDGITSSLIKRKNTYRSLIPSNKRYLDNVGSSLIKRKESDSENNKRYMDSIGSSLIKKSDSERHDKRYMDSIGSSLIKKSESERHDKRYMDSIGSSLIKKSDSERHDKRYMDSIGSSLIKKSKSDRNGKRYMDSVGSSLIKRQFAEGQTNDVQEVKVGKRNNEVINDAYVVKRDVHAGNTNHHHRSRRHLQSDLTSDTDWEPINARPPPQPLPISPPGDNFVAQQHIGFISTPDLSDAPPSVNSFLSNEASLIENMDQSVQHKLETIFDSQHSTPPEQNKDDDLIDDKRYLDYIASNLWFKKRYLDGVNSSLLKKRYIDSIGSSLFKKRYLDSVGSSLVKKRYLDSIGSSLVKKRYLDSVGYSLIKRDFNDNPASEMYAFSDETIPKTKRFTIKSKPLTSSRTQHMSSIKRYIDSIASGLLHRRSPGSELGRLRGLGPFGGSVMGDPSTPALGTSRMRRFSTKWRGRPMAMSASRITGTPPSSPASKSYLRSALKHYVNGVAKEVVDTTKVLGQRQADKEKKFLGKTKSRMTSLSNVGPQSLASIAYGKQPSLGSLANVGRQSLGSLANAGPKSHLRSWNNEAFGEPRARKDFFDSLAGGIF